MSLNDDLFRFFKADTLYEGIICSKYIGSQYINAACMGFRITTEAKIILTPYFETDTIKNLVEGKRFSINISEDPTQYAKAALHGWNKDAFEPEFDLSCYDHEKPFPILKYSSISIIAIVDSLSPYMKNGVLTGNQVNATPEHMIIQSVPRTHSTREFPLILEALISATRAKIARLKLNEPEKLYHYSIIGDVFTKLRRFSKDPLISDAITIIKKWIKENIDDDFENQWE